MMKVLAPQENNFITKVIFEWESIDVTSYKKWIRVPTYSFYRLEPRAYMNLMKAMINKKRNQRFVLLKITTDIVPIWMNIFIKYSKEHQLDPMKKNL